MKFVDGEVARALRARRSVQSKRGLAIIGIAALAACESGEADDKGRVLTAAPEIVEIESFPSTKHGRVKIDWSEEVHGLQILVQAAETLHAAGKAIQAGAMDIPGEIETINFWYTAPDVNNYGEEKRSRIIEFTLKTSDLRRIQYKQVAPEGVLEFADKIRGNAAGRNAIDAYCIQRASDNPRFCSNVNK